MYHSRRNLSCDLSEDDVKTALLALAHLANFLPQWEAELRRVAAKLDESSGPTLYDEFRRIENPGATLGVILRKAR
jgi:hypothetical protein